MHRWYSDEPPEGAGDGEQHDAALPHPGLRPRPRHRSRVRRRARHRRVLRRLQDSQPAAPPVRGGRVFAGLRPHPRRVQEPARRGRHQTAGGSRRRDARGGAGGGDGDRRARRPAHHLRKRAGIRRGAGQVRADRGPPANHVSLHPVHFTDRAGGRHAQHLQPVLGPGVHAGAAQPVVHRVRPVARAVFRSPGHRARLGGRRGRRRPARFPGAFPRAARAAAAVHAELPGRRGDGASSGRWGPRSSACRSAR